MTSLHASLNTYILQVQSLWHTAPDNIQIMQGKLRATLFRNIRSLHSMKYFISYNFIFSRINVLVYVNKFIREKIKLHEMKNAKNMWVFFHTESNNLAQLGSAWLSLAQLGLGDFPWLMYWSLLRICLRTH